MRANKARGSATILGLALLLFGCSDSLEGQTERWGKFLKNNRYGTSSDSWLVKRNAFGDWEKVAVVFGFLDDREFCEDIAGLYMKKYPSDRYRCDSAN